MQATRSCCNFIVAKPKIMIKRRSFLTYFSVGWLSSCFPVVLAACAPSNSNTQGTTTKTEPLAAEDKGRTKLPEQKTADGFTVVGTVADLDKTGQLQVQGIAVTRDPASKKLLAVDPKCTHKGCNVKWIAAEKKYECPCHGADFAADGKVLKGPATQPLATYPAKIQGAQVVVKA
jgi:cytochrome b6-f complex iron-sulfur subunit